MKTDLTLYEIEPCHLTCGEWPSGMGRVTADGWWSPGWGGRGTRQRASYSLQSGLLLLTAAGQGGWVLGGGGGWNQ